MPEVRQVTLFNPETMFKPTAGHSQVAEVKSGKLAYIAGQVPLDQDERDFLADEFLADRTADAPVAADDDVLLHRREVLFHDPLPQ